MTAAAASSASIATKIQHVSQGDALVVKSGGTINVESGGALQIGGVDMTASIASKANDAARYVAAGSTLVLTSANNNQTIKLNALAGSAVTLPAATGSGAKFKFLVSVLATSNSHVISAAAGDVMIGAISGARVDSSNAVLGFAAQSTSNTITLNRTTTGSVTVGEYVEVEDVAAGTWEVSGFLTATGAAFATPFSHV
jgi:hypothetical protein